MAKLTLPCITFWSVFQYPVTELHAPIMVMNMIQLHYSYLIIVCIASTIQISPAGVILICNDFSTR